MPSNQHQRLVHLFALQYQAKTKGFRKEVRELLREFEDAEDIEVPRVTPDLWRIDRTLFDAVTRKPERATIRVWEVDTGHPLADDTLIKYSWFWDDLDATGGLDLELYTIDRFGSEERQPLFVNFMGLLMEGKG